jgi:16S rRNA (guanine527-N7)-methyltransferase
VEALELANVSVIADRAETLGRDPRHRESYGMVTARACAALPVLAELALPLVRVGGQLLAWKGPLTERDDEVRHGRSAIGQVGGGPLEILGTGLPALGGHRFVTVPKEIPTPARFPRRPGEPGRRPLG